MVAYVSYFYRNIVTGAVRCFGGQHLDTSYCRCHDE
jgi:hypothetical protein